MLELLEKLINERGSAAVIRERLGLVKAQYEILELRCADLQAQLDTANAELEQLRLQAKNNDAATSTYACDHCGSSSLKRTGSRPNPTFGVLGMKDMIFTCLDCGAESVITPPDD